MASELSQFRISSIKESTSPSPAKSKIKNEAFGRVQAFSPNCVSRTPEYQAYANARQHESARRRRQQRAPERQLQRQLRMLERLDRKRAATLAEQKV